MIKNIKVEQAAVLLGKRPQFIRIGLQEGRLPIGVAIKGRSRWTYHITPGGLADYMHITRAELEDLLTNKL